MSVVGTTTTSRPPIALLVLVAAALVVVGLILSQAAVALFIRLVQLVLILVGFAVIAFLGLYLLRKGDLGPDQGD